MDLVLDDAEPSEPEGSEPQDSGEEASGDKVGDDAGDAGAAASEVLRPCA